ncbi:MAG: argininosuccinate lyase, partial [Peptococcaceae bacterium]|nr:argininosuccinate lyase [Peptococcaceae bacterium]
MPNLWGGRFSIPTDQLVSLLNNSIPFDWRLAPYDIRGSTAWARSLQKAGILSEEEARRIVGGLTSIQNEVSENTFNISPQDEDVHSAIERRLGEMIGPLAGKLHTGRSRNDQVMADFNLWMKDSINLLAQYLKGLQNSLLNRAKRDHNVILPGYTHFQRAQPVLLSHWWLSHFWPLERDLLNLAHSYRLADVLPLGSGALAGTPFA